jgi:hypothetical protein
MADILLESGDDLLLESGDTLLSEESGIPTGDECGLKLESGWQLLLEDGSKLNIESCAVVTPTEPVALRPGGRRGPYYPDRILDLSDDEEVLLLI